MTVELLHIDECPNSNDAAERVKTALDALGHPDEEVRMRLVGSAAEMAGTAFAGSPTITVDGVDIFPEGAPAGDLACRIYRTPAGFAGLPTVEQIQDALGQRGF
ncbi:thioredoxin family protein [Arthrobacter sp. KK5.5]|uniref:thioredoxin family protein n=1 Tax=Arthrobacter sp. KK5.5 TaxID=3373084 RepID=UPI003EE7FF97